MGSKIVRFLIPFAILFSLLGLLGSQLFNNQKETLPSALIADPVPAFNLPDLLNPQKNFSDKELRGRVTLLNVWATWCYACRLEHPFLLKISREYHIPIYGIDYKDNDEDAKNWLLKLGNPYTMIGEDKNGDVAIDLGVYGTPETFIISPDGKIIYRHVGIINESVWQKTLLPLILQYNRAT